MPLPGRGRELDIEPLNLTPLLDCILNLIFFFLLATQIKKSDQPVLEVHLPRADLESRVSEEPQQIRVTLAPDGRLFLNDDAVTTQDLELKLGQLADSQDTPRPVQIITDGTKTNVQRFVDIVEICQRTGHTSYQLLLEERKRAP